MDEIASRPEQLFHYTSAAGLIGILDRSELWASDIKYLNDSAELQYGASRYIPALEAVASELEGQPDTDLPIDEPSYRATSMLSAANWIKSTAGGVPSTFSLVGPFVTCFCSVGDLLSQWRGYATDGYALGFRTEPLAAIAPYSTGRFFAEGTVPYRYDPDGRYSASVSLLRVDYGEDAVDRMIERTVPATAPYPNSSMAKLGGPMNALSQSLIGLASVKHPAFEEEQEWRLLYHGGEGEPDQRFRQTTRGLQPYVAVPINLGLTLASVRVGPGSAQGLRATSLAQMLGARGLYDVDILTSDAPYRE